MLRPERIRTNSQVEVPMRSSLFALAAALSVGLTVPAAAQQASQPV